MKYDEFRRQLGKAGITARAFADLLGLHRNSITNYSTQGVVPDHLAIIVTLMGELAEHKLDFHDAIHRLAIEPNRPRGTTASGRFGGSRQDGLF